MSMEMCHTAVKAETQILDFKNVYVLSLAHGNNIIDG